MDARTGTWVSHSEADVQATTLTLFVERRRLEAELSQAVPDVSLERVLDAPPGLHPLLIDLWQVENGHLTPAGWDMLDGSQALGSAVGAAAGVGVGAAAFASYAGLLGFVQPPEGTSSQARSWWASGVAALSNQALGTLVGGFQGAQVGSSLAGQAARDMAARGVRRFGSYREILVAIPSVRWGSEQNPRQLVLGMYTNSRLARWGEQVLGYGFGKRLAEIDIHSWSDVNAFTPDGSRLLRGRWTVPDEFFSYPRLPAFVPPWLAQSLLGLRRGRPVASLLQRGWCPGQTELRQITGSLEIGPQLLPGIVAERYELDAFVDGAPPRAARACGFQTRALRLQLSFPKPSRMLSDSEGGAAGMTRHKRTRVAIVGGGCASVAAAFELTRPELGSKFDVTIYQLGWRLGGKGASGRGACDRIEEHGLHLWMGFYENAFRLMRECYAELGRDPEQCPIADWRDAFSPCPLSAVADFGAGGKWLQWKVLFPASPGSPGEPITEGTRWTLGKYLTRCLMLVRTLFDSLQENQAPPLASLEPPAPEPANANDLLERISRLLSFGRLGTLTALREAMRLFEAATQWLPQLPQAAVLGLHGLLKEALEVELARMTRQDEGMRRLWEIMDLMLAVVRGFVWHRLPFDPRGLDAINDYDCREWLRMHGASEAALNSAFVRGLYDLAFAYADGDFQRPSIAAGQAVRGAFRAFFTYRGAFFWKMHSGMGDAVFAPLYEVLRKRGVRFAFFHRLLDIKPGASGEGEGRFVDGLEFRGAGRGARGHRVSAARQRPRPAVLALRAAI